MVRSKIEKTYNSNRMPLKETVLVGWFIVFNSSLKPYKSGLLQVLVIQDQFQIMYELFQYCKNIWPTGIWSAN